MLDFNISHQIGGKNILKNLSHSLTPGNHLLILGDSGTGKTTLLSILAGIQKPSKGIVKYNNSDIYSLKSTERDGFRGKNIGIIFQKLHLIPVISVRENLSLISKINLSNDNQSHIDELINNLDLKEKEHQKSNKLSIGEQQRVAIARALVNKPKWLLADEPTSALDDKNTKKTIKLLMSQAEQNNTSLIIATHDKRIKDAFSENDVIELNNSN